MTRAGFMAIGLAGTILSCCAGGQMPGEDLGPLAQYPGSQLQIENYYDDNAVESDWDCTEVQMDAITRAKVVREDATNLVVAVHYDFQPADGGTGGARCQGFHTRIFTFSKAGSGLTLESMSGEQRNS
jgi:hypothetical protein